MYLSYIIYLLNVFIYFLIILAKFKIKLRIKVVKNNTNFYIVFINLFSN